jgi:hypothetical protein
MTGIAEGADRLILLSIGACGRRRARPGAVMEVSGGSQSFNAVNLRCASLAVDAQTSRSRTSPRSPRHFSNLTRPARMKPSAYYERVVDVDVELDEVFTLVDA